MPFWTYILHCNAGVFYTGHTDVLDRRVADHKAGRFKGFSKRFLPVELVWAQEFSTREEAKAAEKQIKGWSRKKKLALIREDWPEISRLAKKKSSPSTSSGQTGFVVAGSVMDQLRDSAAQAHPRECCGILLGAGGRITRAYPTQNVHPAPETHFEMDPQALIDAHRAAREGGPQVIGYYHSHPTGDAVPSETDRAMASGDGRIWAIIARREITFWRDSPDAFEPLSYNVFEG